MFSRFRFFVKGRDYFGFLWQEKHGSEPIVCRLDRLPLGASCSPFVDIYAVHRIFKDNGTADNVIRAVKQRMYVNN